MVASLGGLTRGPFAWFATVCVALWVGGLVIYPPPGRLSRTADTARECVHSRAVWRPHDGMSPADHKVTAD